MEVQESYMYTHLASSLAIYLKKVSRLYRPTIYQVHNYTINMRLTLILLPRSALIKLVVAYAQIGNI